MFIMSYRELPEDRSTHSRTWFDPDTGQTQLTAFLTPIATREAGGSLVEVDLTPTPIADERGDGWHLRAGDLTLVVGRLPDQEGDGWLEYRLQPGRARIASRLLQIGILPHMDATPSLAADFQPLFGPDGVAVYDRAQFRQQAEPIVIGPLDETRVPEATLEWRDLWQMPGGGSIAQRFRVNAAGIKEVLVVNAAAAAWIRQSLRSQEGLVGFIYALNLTGIATVKGDQQMALDTLDVIEADGIAFHNHRDQVVAFLPPGDLFLNPSEADEEMPLRLRLHKRLWRDADGQVYLFVGLPAADFASLPDGEVLVDPTLNLNVGASADDAFQAAGGSAQINGTSLNVGSSGTSLPRQAVGVRFPAVNIPVGSRIDSASLSFKKNGTGFNTIYCTTYGHKVINPPAFSAGENLTARPYTGQSLLCPDDNVNRLDGSYYALPQNGSIKAIVQEIIDQPGWASGNPMAFIVEGNEPTGFSNAAFWAYDSGAANAPKLDVTYTASALATLPDASNTGAPYGDLVWAGDPFDDNTINLRTGEVMKQVADLRVMSPTGPLEFIRTYRQGKRADTDFNFMGLGWTHNHAVKLKSAGSSPNVLTMILPNAGELVMDETGVGSNQYVARPGSAATADWNITAANQYTVIAPDRSRYVFNASFQLVTRSWPSTETWTYTYTSGKLTEVTDGYGRKLVFAYKNNPGQYDDGRLWRVGDHNTTNLSGTTPTGRYVEFSYVPQKLNGVTVTNPKALLSTVRDVRGQTWTHYYYGRAAGQSAVIQQDLLIELFSPSVDTSGDGALDGLLSLEKLTYTFGVDDSLVSILRQLGDVAGGTTPLMTKTYTWIYTRVLGGYNVTAQVSVQSKVTEYFFLGGVLASIKDAGNNLTQLGFTDRYRPAFIIDPNGGISRQSWSIDGKLLLQSRDALGNTTVYSYYTTGANADALGTVWDAQGRKTQYTYSDATNPRLPTRIQFYDLNGTTVLRWQEFTYDSKGRVTEEKILDPANGTTILKRVNRSYYTAAGNGFGLLNTMTERDVVNAANDRTTTYEYDNVGRVIKTSQTSLFGSCKFGYSVYDAAGNVEASVCSLVSVNPPTTRAAAEALYNTSNPDQYRITSFHYDTLGRKVKTVVNAGSSDAKTTLTPYDEMSRPTRTIQNFIPNVTNTPNPFISNRTNFAHGSYNDANLVADVYYNKRGFKRKEVDILDVVTLYGYDDAGRVIKVIKSASNGTYNNEFGGDPTLTNYTPNNPTNDPDKDIITTFGYDQNGNQIKVVNPLGVISYSAYDALNRLVRVVQAAKDSADITLNPGDAGYAAAHDPRSASYVASADADRDAIQTTEYDALARTIRIKRLVDNRPTEVWETTLMGYDGLGRTVRVLQNASQPAYNLTTDPALASYSASNNADQDVESRTLYDPLDRVIYAATYPESTSVAVRNWTAYDGLGRVVKQIINAVGTATDGGINDPRSATYVPSSSPDKDLVTTTVYNSDNQVQAVTDSLGRVTRFVYDSRGRVIRTIRNFVDQGEDPALWVYNSGWKKINGTTAIGHGTNNDENIISGATYDARGRLSQDFDHRNNVTLHRYDELDRELLTVVNYVPQGSSDPLLWRWITAYNRWETSLTSGVAVSFGADADQNRITFKRYNLAGNLIHTQYHNNTVRPLNYDLVRRMVTDTINPVTGTYDEAIPDQDLIRDLKRDKAGQVIWQINVRGIKTEFVYDKLGRQQQIKHATNQALVHQRTDYTVYDKLGRVLRQVLNYVIPSPPEEPYFWVFDAMDSRWEKSDGTAIAHGNNDQNVITVNTVDGLGRPISVRDPLGIVTQFAYYKDGKVRRTTDEAGIITEVRYDGLRRAVRQVQGYVQQGNSDPAQWVWDATDNRWEYPTNLAITHGTNNDQNLISDTTYDKAGRVTQQRDPRGTTFSLTYDKLDRRQQIQNPLATWYLDYVDEVGAGTKTLLTYPGVNGGGSYNLERRYNRHGAQVAILYGDPANTPDVKFSHFSGGLLSKMSEYAAANFTSRIRETTYYWDKVNRVTAIDFDTNGNGTMDEQVDYQHTGDGLTTVITHNPAAVKMGYWYTPFNQVASMTHWGGAYPNYNGQWAYDKLRRPVTIARPYGATAPLDLTTTLKYDLGGRVTEVKHLKGARVVGHYAYSYDVRGNRTQMLEAQPRNGSGSTIFDVNTNANAIQYPQGTWSNVNGYRETTSTNAIMKFMFFGDTTSLIMGKGPDHGQYDLFLNGEATAWQTKDGYVAAASDETISIPSSKLVNDGPHTLEIRHKGTKHASSSGFKLRFKSLTSAFVYDLQTVVYTYDNLSRVRDAKVYPGLNTGLPDASLLRRYQYQYDRMHNRTQQIVTIAGVATTTNYTYNAANQLTGDGTFTYEYDANGNLRYKKQGATIIDTYTWDRANRLLSLGSTSYKYNGLGHRVEQNAGGVISKYTLDLQAKHVTTLAETIGANVIRYVHGPQGIFAQKDAANNWEWMVNDALGSVRGMVNSTAAMLESRMYSPYGEPYGNTGTVQTVFGFTGEQTDSNGMVYLRARYYLPGMGTFASLDPAETFNRYGYVNGNPIMRTDPSGLLMGFSGSAGGTGGGGGYKPGCKKVLDESDGRPNRYKWVCPPPNGGSDPGSGGNSDGGGATGQWGEGDDTDAIDLKPSDNDHGGDVNSTCPPNYRMTYLDINMTPNGVPIMTGPFCLGGGETKNPDDAWQDYRNQKAREGSLQIAAVPWCFAGEGQFSGYCLGYHTFLIYTDENGVQTQFRGVNGGLAWFGRIRIASGRLGAQSLPAMVDGTLQGDMAALTNPEDNLTLDVPSGSEDAVFTCLTNAMTDMNGQVEYNVMGPNSNTVIYTALRRCGVNPELPAYVMNTPGHTAPGWGQELPEQNPTRAR